MQVYPDKEEFCRLADTYTVLPVWAELSTDLETPVSLYYKVVGDKPGFILESAQTGKNFGRYSFIGTKPLAGFTAYRDYAETILRDGSTTTQTGKPHLLFKEFLAQFFMPKITGLPLLPAAL